jgi:hypothetical protein
MITILSSPKAFSGNVGQNQIIAIKSWLRVHPEIEVILYGRSEGAEEVCSQLGIRYVTDILCHENGLPYFNAIVKHARSHSKHDILIYLNCDIILNKSVLYALKLFKFQKFLIIGERIDLADGVTLDTGNDAWLTRLKNLLDRGEARLHGVTGKDYFIFPNNMWEALPPLIIGRGGYDSALIAYCLRRNIPVIDATLKISAIHLYHGYKMINGTNRRITQDDAAVQNIKLHDIVHSGPTVSDADWSIIGNGLHRNYSRGDWLRYCEIFLRYRMGLKSVSYILRMCWRILHWARFLKPKRISTSLVIKSYR